jgi:hypothetical protein
MTNIQCRIAKEEALVSIVIPEYLTLSWQIIQSASTRATWSLAKIS